MLPGDNDDKFEVNARFTLGSGNDGINPLTENVTIEVGNVSKTIPAGSFTRNKQGAFKFDGTVDGTSLTATIKPVSGGFQVQASGIRTDFTDSELPLLLGVTIGNDKGTVLLKNAKLLAGP
jgi:hypothetical protein